MRYRNKHEENTAAAQCVVKKNQKQYLCPSNITVYHPIHESPTEEIVRDHISQINTMPQLKLYLINNGVKYLNMGTERRVQFPTSEVTVLSFRGCIF